MPRQARLDAPGTLHHVMVRGIERRRIVRDRKDREEFVRRLGEIAQETATAVYAWALLDNHAHLLVRSGPGLLSGFMRRLLTGYAVFFNRRHKRHGHLFQNRYKSIVCEEDRYFTELVRYIHLNPLRAGLAAQLADLDRYPYSGHSCLMGYVQRDWQARDYVLGWFGDREGAARRAYRRFLADGLDQGRRPDLVGGGLVRSAGGWSEVRAMRRRGERALSDPRVLGSGPFVEGLLREAEERQRRAFGPDDLEELIDQVIEQVCANRGVERLRLERGSRCRAVAAARREIARRLAVEHGVSLAEIARRVGITTAGVWRLLR
ncbi:MAG: hypothetical protein D6739_01080 [Nitrospirae bacterium]|nr:MAG: hypothetical protein D6739_01080 [Nitrospirota bacterium]